MDDTIRKLEEVLRSDPERAAKLDGEFRRLRQSGETSEPEAYLQAVKNVFGMDIRLSDLEKRRAEAEELDADELERVSGGGSENAALGSDNWCWADYQCVAVFKHDTDRHDTDDACAYDYNCILICQHETVM